MVHDDRNTELSGTMLSTELSPEIAELFLTHGAAVQVRSEHELEETLITLMSDSVRRASLGAAARALVDANRGATDRTLDVLTSLLPRPAVVRPFRRVH